MSGDQERGLTEPALGVANGRGRLSGRSVLVIGAGQQRYGLTDPPVGNGSAMSRLFAREGAHVALVDIDRDAAEETARRIREEGADAITIVADVSRPEELDRVVREARSELGGLDGVAVNVGVAGGWGLGGTTAEQWDHVFAINVRAHFLACKEALGVMPSGAAVVLTSSIAARMPANDVVAYHASKAALDGLCIWLAKHAAHRGVRVNLVVPGLIDTPLGRLATRASPDRDERPVPLGRHGTAWEVAYAAAFLLSDEASYVTGHSLVVDGGLVALR